MSFDLAQLKDCITRHGPTARVTIAQTQGSAPREAGTAMLVWANGQSGTIGGGALEFEAVRAARQLLPGAAPLVARQALGPALGQCCGGAVTLVTEIFTADDVKPLETAPLFCRRIEGTADLPIAFHHARKRAREAGDVPAPEFREGWLLEPILTPRTPLWIWGAGHVGRAMIGVLGPLPNLALTWVDTDRTRFPETLPGAVSCLHAKDPIRFVPYAPEDAHHLILTYSHALDLALCHALLQRGFVSAGLIGSHSKWARFRKRLADLGHSGAEIARITCPIGDPGLGKHPQAIALGTATALLAQISTPIRAKDRTA